MQKISKIILKNFKFFYGEIPIILDRKHVLFYGENGSGKSSVYWALYTFLQSVFKTDVLEVKKYFDVRHDENLVNRFAVDTAPSGITVEMEDENKGLIRREISSEAINTLRDSVIIETTLGSDFLDYKVLSRIYAYYHKEEIDLFDFFQHHLMAFINFREELIRPGEATGTKNAERWWEYFEEGLTPKPKMHEDQYKDFQRFVASFNTEFKYYLEQIEKLTNDYIKIRLKENFTIKFNYVNGTYNDFKPGTTGRSWAVKPPKILLTVYLVTNLITDENKRKVTSPQSFLNEAKLSALALAMRMAILDEKFVAAYPKILVLDDLLISMDMSNREFVMGMLLENYCKDYQIIFFTHQRSLFEDVRKYIEIYYSDVARKAGETSNDIIKQYWSKNWLLYEMYETEGENGIPIPSIQPYESNLQKAFKYFKKDIDYNACGNYLRMSLEEFFRKFVPRSYFVTDGGTPIPASSMMLDGLLSKARTYFTEVGFDTDSLAKLDRYRTRSLNPASHYNPQTEYYKRELLEIFSIIHTLEENKNLPVLEKDSHIRFRIETISGRIFNYRATLLDDIILYKKADGSDSYFNSRDKREYAMVSCEVDGTVRELNHIIRSKTLLELYNETIAFINRTEQANEAQDIFEIFTNDAGVSLNALKAY